MPKKEAEIKLLGEAQASLKRIQEFDVNTLPREKELGNAYNFKDVIEPANRIIDLYKRLPLSVLEDFGVSQLTTTKNQADGNFNLFGQILDFDPVQSNAQTVHQGFIDTVEAGYQAVFNHIYPLVGYSLHKSADFQRLDSEARATLQQIKDDAKDVQNELQAQKDAGNQILKEIRSVAGETGVTKQAQFFKNEAIYHDEKSEVWKKLSFKLAWVLVAYSIASLFLHTWTFLSPTNTYESIQLAVSKILIFAVISYMLYLSTRNFLSHKHNSIVNRHRQNALLTYRALVEATNDPQSNQAILIQAASCIYSPQPTGYSGDSTTNSLQPTSIIELLSKPLDHGK